MGKLSRRGVLKVLAGSAGMVLGQPFAHARQKSSDNALDMNVQLQFMRPSQIEAAGKRFPAIYVPFGTIEWHGRHLPVGCDALKAHGILVKAAMKHGGVVHPPIFFHEGFPREHWVPMVAALFERLRWMGYRVIIGVSGHNVQGQIDVVETALKPVLTDGTVAGVGLWEVTLSHGPDTGTDHAAKWETSDMQFFYPSQVDVSALGSGVLKLDMKAPDGIGGDDPRKTASASIGARNVELCADAIGKKAHELLLTLPEKERGFRLKSVSPENWWML